MKALDIDQQIAVIGAGIMGAGIAQVAATAGHQVVLFDVAAGAATKGLAGVKSGLEKLVARGKKSQEDVDSICSRILPTEDITELSEAALVIEAVVEKIDIKRAVFAELEALCSSETIIASNTSSISISALAADLQHPERLLGMHFFNPAAVLKLVEVISGVHTSALVADIVFETAKSWGKIPVHAKSTPGFIVNRVARSFYAEALRSLNEQAASAATIDQVMRASGGFRMGPFELMDLIGQDINLAVSESVYQAYYGDKRFQPSVLQAEMVAGGLLGRKSQKGHYPYSDAAESDLSKHLPEHLPEYLPASRVTPSDITVVGDLGIAEELVPLFEAKGIVVNRKDCAQEAESMSAFSGEYHTHSVGYIIVGQSRLQLTNGLSATHIAANCGQSELVLFDLARSYANAETLALAPALQASEQALIDVMSLFSSIDKRACRIKDVPGMLLMRTLCCLVNEAADAVNQGVCSVDAVDTAMKLGVNYPEGPLEWGQRLGLHNVVGVLKNLQLSYGEERYRCSPWLLNQRFLAGV